ncbi:hypothetical protein Tco_1302721 [Tanacetum coccineum]
MEEELYNLIVKGNDLKHYARRFQELTILCPNMVPNNEKLLEAFIGGLPRSIEGNILKHNSVQEANDRKLKIEETPSTATTIANNSYNSDYPNNLDNNNHPNNHNDNRNHDHHPQKNGRQETLRTYAVSPTKYTRPPKKYLGILPLCTRLRDVAVYYHFAISTFPVEIVIKSSTFILEYSLELPIKREEPARGGELAHTTRVRALSVAHISTLYYTSAWGLSVCPSSEGWRLGDSMIVLVERDSEDERSSNIDLVVLSSQLSSSIDDTHTSLNFDDINNGGGVD